MMDFLFVHIHSLADFRNLIGYLLVACGIFFALTAAVGILRMPDFYTRLHPAGMVDSLAAPTILLGLILLEDFNFISLKMILLIIFLLVTSSTACQALAKAALLSGMKPLGKIVKRETDD